MKSDELADEIEQEEIEAEIERTGEEKPVKQKKSGKKKPKAAKAAKPEKPKDTGPRISVMVSKETAAMLLSFSKKHKDPKTGKPISVREAADKMVSIAHRRQAALTRYRKSQE